MAVIAVVLVADNDQVGRLVDRQIASRVRRAIGIEDDPQALSFDQERGMAVPGDAHGRVISLGVWNARARAFSLTSKGPDRDDLPS